MNNEMIKFCWYCRWVRQFEIFSCCHDGGKTQKRCILLLLISVLFNWRVKTFSQSILSEGAEKENAEEQMKESLECCGPQEEESFEENAENIPSPDVLYWDGEKYTSKEAE